MQAKGVVKTWATAYGCQRQADLDRPDTTDATSAAKSAGLAPGRFAVLQPVAPNASRLDLRMLYFRRLLPAERFSYQPVAEVVAGQRPTPYRGKPQTRGKAD
jgi:hypothetical protein